jgi:hypothetical protein
MARLRADLARVTQERDEVVAALRALHEDGDDPHGPHAYKSPLDTRLMVRDLRRERDEARVRYCDVCGADEDGRVWGDVDVCRGCYEAADQSLQAEHERQRADRAEAEVARLRAVVEAARAWVRWLEQKGQPPSSGAGGAIVQAVAALDALGEP